MWESQCREIFTNSVVDVIRTPTDPVVEPVSVALAKEFLKLQSNDDVVLTQLITEAREWVENKCGISLVPTECVAILEIMNEQEIPYGPIVGDIEIKDIYGNIVAQTAYNVVGGMFPRINGYGRFTVTYTAGYDPVPSQLIGAMLNYIAYSYENRGDELDKSDKPFANEARRKSDPFRRTIGF